MKLVISVVRYLYCTLRGEAAVQRAYTGRKYPTRNVMGRMKCACLHGGATQGAPAAAAAEGTHEVAQLLEVLQSLSQPVHLRPPFPPPHVTLPSQTVASLLGRPLIWSFALRTQGVPQSEVQSQGPACRSKLPPPSRASRPSNARPALESVCIGASQTSTMAFICAHDQKLYKSDLWHCPTKVRLTAGGQLTRNLCNDAKHRSAPIALPLASQANTPPPPHRPLHPPRPARCSHLLRPPTPGLLVLHAGTRFDE